MEASDTLLGVRGHLIDAPVWGRLRSWPDGGLVIDGGRIAEVGEYWSLRKRPREREIRWLDSPGQVVFPGLIDLHTHLPQYPSVARGESELLPWLRQHIFPVEREFTGPAARRVPARFFAELARHGTTTAGVYCAVFEDTCEAAFTAAEKSGMRVVMGKMMMDVGSYGTLQPRKAVSISLLESERLCRKWNGAAEGRIDYAFSPRFAVSCSEKMLRGAGDLARSLGAYLQTHLAENIEEIEKVRNLFMWARDYTDVYAQCGMLGPKTLLGHAIHLSDTERAALAEHGAAVVHCPTSNFYLNSGAMPLDRMRAAGIRIGLGSDVAAGPELNLWRVMRAAVEIQKARSWYGPETRVIGPAEAFFMATQGGAEAIGKGGQIGTFDLGKEADFIVMDLAPLIPYGRDGRLAPPADPADIVALCVYRAGPEAVVRTHVRGREISRAGDPALF
jgi:guanine deaminase